MNVLLEQFKKRRLALGLKQNDMLLRIGVSRQQYQRLESKGNPRLDTLSLVASGLNSELMLIPREKRAAVLALLASDDPVVDRQMTQSAQQRQSQSWSENPWQGLLVDDEP